MDVTTSFRLPKRLLVGDPMRSTQLNETLLPKRLALPVYCSDPISSNAYATEEILLVLALGGASAVLLTPWVAMVVVGLLALVTISYRQTCYAYPDGGGAYAVSKDNLGRTPSLIAAAALLVDYVMTVAVSIASSVENLVSAFPDLHPYSVALGVGFIVVLTVMNLRGVRESGTLFAIPTYGFILSVFVMLGAGFWQVLNGNTPVAESAGFSFEHGGPVGAALLILLLRAFASGCTSLTGVEAVSNGVPTFRTPKSRNASITLLAMAALSISMMLGISFLSSWSGVRIAENVAELTGTPDGYVQRTVLAQLSAAVFGNNSMGFFAVQAFTVLILAMAANTAFNGFPILASLLAEDRFLPKQLGRRGDRLVFSNGILILASVAGGLIVAFDGSVTKLIQLYILGVFVSFTLSQVGMVVYWRRQAVAHGWTPAHFGSAAVNAVGAVATAVVLVIVLLTKFTHGAYLVVIAMPLLVWMMLRINSHYREVSRQLTPRVAGITLPSRIHAVVLISQLNEPSLQALAFARAIRPSTITALRVDTSAGRTRKLVDEWAARDIPVPLTIVASAFRDLTQPVLDFLAKIHVGPRDVVQVFIPEYVVGHWWEQVLHNQSALRLKSRLLSMPGVMVTSVPYQLSSAAPYALGRPGAAADAVVAPRPARPTGPTSSRDGGATSGAEASTPPSRRTRPVATRTGVWQARVRDPAQRGGADQRPGHEAVAAPAAVRLRRRRPGLPPDHGRPAADAGQPRPRHGPAAVRAGVGRRVGPRWGAARAGRVGDQRRPRQLLLHPPLRHIAGGERERTGRPGHLPGRRRAGGRLHRGRRPGARTGRAGPAQAEWLTQVGNREHEPESVELALADARAIYGMHAVSLTEAGRVLVASGDPPGRRRAAHLPGRGGADARAAAARSGSARTVACSRPSP